MKKIATLFAVLLCVTFVGHILFFYFGTPYNLAQKTKFYDYDSFLAFIEDGEKTANEENLRVPITVKGKTVCEFTYRNRSVMVAWNSRSDDALPISVIDWDDYAAAGRVRTAVNWTFWGLYAVEITTAVITARKMKKNAEI